MMINLHNTFIYPHLFYGVELWGHDPDLSHFLNFKFVKWDLYVLSWNNFQTLMSPIHFWNFTSCRFPCCTNFDLSFYYLLNFFTKNYILKQEDNYNNVENQYEIKTWKSSENPHKPIKGWTENGKGSMFVIACNLFGELAWDLQDVSSRVCRRQLATCLLKLVGSWLLAFSSLGWTIWNKQHSEQVDI